MSNTPARPDLKDVTPGSDADASPASGTTSNPNAPAKPDAVKTGEGKQQDDNIDDKGNKPDGGRLDQPT